MDMGMVNAFSAIQQSNTRQQIDMAVAKKSIDAQRDQGQAVLQLLNAATSAGPGDALAAAATGLGGQIDVRA
jgi:hypothetical protein